MSIAAPFRYVIVGSLWLGCALLAIVFTSHAAGLAAVWPANAILATALLIERKRYWGGHIIAVSIASLLSSLIVGRPLGLGVGFVAVGVLEAILASLLIARFSPVAQLFDRPSSIFRFTIAAIAACIPSSIIVGGLLAFFRDQSWIVTTVNWMPSHACGMLITTPTLLILHKAIAGAMERGVRKEDLYGGAAMLGLVGAVTALVFQQSSYAITFLIVPALLVATFHLRAVGAACSVVIIAIVGSYYMVHGSGPLSMMPVAAVQQIYVMELFITTMFLCALPLAAVLDQRDRLGAEANRHLVNFRAIVDRIGEVLFRIEDDGRWAYLSPAYEAITGRPAAAAIGQSALLDLPEEDHAALIRAFEGLRTGEVGDLSFPTTIVDVRGAVRHIEIDIFRCMLDIEDRTGICGILRDVTARKMLDAQLRERAVAARQAAEQSELAARTDELTRLPNRRAFLERLDRRLAEGGGHTALALFDIDHFKRVNDGYGHPAGDEVLRRIAATAAANLRDGDMVARIGGEEFAVLLNDIAPDAAVATAERMIAAIAAEAIVLPGDLTGAGNDVDVHVTISMGLIRPSHGEDAVRLLAMADRALYAAKQGGRNRLELAA